MADEKIRIDIDAEDDASKVLDDVAASAEKLEKLTPEITVGADTDKAKRGLQEVLDDAERLGRSDQEIVLKARIDDAKAGLKALRDDLDQTGDQARRTGEQLDRIGGDGDGGLRTRGNAIADLTGPLGDASGAASDFAGVFDGLGDIAEDVAGRVGVSTAAMSTAIGGIGIAVAAAAAVWTLYRQRQDEARKRQEELVKGQRELNTAIREGNAEAAAKQLTEMYDDAYKAAERLGVNVSDVTRYITGQSDAIPTLIGRHDDLRRQLEGIQTTSGPTRDALAALVLQYDDLVGRIDGARQSYTDANGSIEEQDQKLANVAQALGLAKSATEDVTRANERAERQARLTAAGFDRISGALDIEQAAINFRSKLDAALADTRAKADLTAQEILDIKQSILDVASAAGLTPIEVRTYLDRIDQGDIDGVMSDVNHRLATRSAEVQTSLKPPTQAEYAQMAETIRRGVGTIYLTAALNNLRSGVYG